MSHHSWQLLFWMVLPIALLDVAFAYVLMADVLSLSNPRIDAWSILTLRFGGRLFGGVVGWHTLPVWDSLIFRPRISLMSLMNSCAVQ